MGLKTVDVSQSIFGFPAAIARDLAVVNQRLHLTDRAVDMAALNTLARNNAQDASAFNGDPFLWAALITNNRVDSYYTRMNKSSLTNYTADATEGRSFQNSHNTDELPLGRSLWSEMGIQPSALVLGDEFGGGSDDLIEVAAAFYTAPNLRLTGVNTDDFIRGVKLGLINDVSIGFYHAHYTCSICGLDLFDWDCPHIPGFSYNVTDNAGKVTGTRVAFAWIDDARLAEVSAVFKGSTPGAAVLKAQVEAEGGRIAPVERKSVESRYRIVLPEKRLVIAVPPVQVATEGTDMAVDEDNRANPASPPPATNPPNPAPPPSPGTSQELRAPDSRDGIGPAELAIVTTLRQVLETSETAEPDALKGFRALATVEGVRQLVALAGDGRRYRADLITEAKAQGVRAYGAEGFSEPHYGPILERADIETIKRFTADWKATGDKRFAGGPQARPEGVDNAPPASAGMPDSAYM